MQLYPQKYDKLCLSSDEKSFLRVIERATAGNDSFYCVLHINPRKKATEQGAPEIFDLLVWDRGILLLRFLESDDVALVSTLCAGVLPLYSRKLVSDLTERLEESRYLIGESGALKYGIGVCFVFPKIDSVDNLSGSDTDNAAVLSFAMFKEDLLTLRREGLQKIESYVPAKNTVAEGDVNCIFQRLCPEITIPRKCILTSENVGYPNDQKVSVADRAVLSYRLDADQINIINRIDHGHQLILACAGSGKSVLLISKCFKIASLNPTQNFLITCYNRNLYNYYQWAIAQAGFTDRNVRCLTFYGLCRQLLESNGLKPPSRDQKSDSAYYDALFEMADNALRKGQITDRFAGIFIDEVQIFKPEWYRFCFNLLKSKKSDEYFFVIAGDKSQDIKNNIRHGKAPWQGGGEGFPEYRGKTLPIEINYRNSKPINDAIDRYVGCAKTLASRLGVDLSSDPELFLRGTAYRDGNDPRLIELKTYSNTAESNAIGNAVKELMRKGYSEVDIAIVLYNSRANNISSWHTPYYNLLGGIRYYFEREGWEDPAVLIFGENEGVTYGSRTGVTVTTIEGSLGLDFRAVILAGLLPLGTHEQVRSVKDFENASGELLVEKQEAFRKNVNMIYTGCTRAKDELYIVLSAPRGDSMYMDLLRDSI